MVRASLPDWARSGGFPEPKDKDSVFFVHALVQLGAITGVARIKALKFFSKKISSREEGFEIDGALPYLHFERTSNPELKCVLWRPSMSSSKWTTSSFWSEDVSEVSWIAQNFENA